MEAKFKYKFKKYTSKLKILNGGNVYPKVSKISSLMTNSEHLQEFKNYLQNRIDTGKQNWLVLGAKYDPDMNKTEAARFSNENWIFFDTSDDLPDVKYTFVGNAKDEEIWNFLGDNFQNLFHYICDDYQIIDSADVDIVANMEKMLVDGGVIAIVESFGNFFSEGENLSVSDEGMMCMMNYEDTTPFYIYSGGGTTLQSEFFGKINRTSNFVDRLNANLREIYDKILKANNTDIDKNCIKTQSRAAKWEACSWDDFFKFLCLYKNDFCGQNSELDELLKRLNSDETKRDILDHIYLFSYEWNIPEYREDKLYIKAENENYKKYIFYLKKKSV